MKDSRVKMPIGEMIYLYRMHRRMSLRQLAKRIGVAASTLCRIEAGNYSDVRTFVQILDWMTTHELPEVMP